MKDFHRVHSGSRSGRGCMSQVITDESVEADADSSAPPIASINIHVPISIIVPTYRESKNIPLLLERLARLREDRDIDIEVIFMDDSSNDGSVEAVAACGFAWARIIVREGNRGLSLAVIDGLRAATHSVLVCMDCDLSHPPEKIPELILALQSGQQFVIGSRYVPGGSTDDDWGFFRWLNSRVATLLAAPLVSVRDPMSGFFAIRKADFIRARQLNPIGYKIGLELIVKCGLENVGEVPIHFSDRVHGESKLSFKEQLKYLQHLRRLYIHRFVNAMEFLQFAVVGATGTVVNLAVLSLFQLLGSPDFVALAAGVSFSLFGNFLLNRRFTFGYARDQNAATQFWGFLVASIIGMFINFSVATALASSVLKETSFGLQLAALAGIVCGLGFNFLGNRFVVFRKRHVVQRENL